MTFELDNDFYANDDTSDEVSYFAVGVAVSVMGAVMSMFSITMMSQGIFMLGSGLIILALGLLIIKASFEVGDKNIATNENITAEKSQNPFFAYAVNGIQAILFADKSDSEINAADKIGFKK